MTYHPDSDLIARVKNRSLVFVVGFLCAITTPLVQAGSATWSATPATNDWNTAANWSPMTVPNGPGDTAAFATSSTTSLSISATTAVAATTFAAGAESFKITIDRTSLTLTGAGIINDSGVQQGFVVLPEPSAMEFTGSADAGRQTVFTVTGGNGYDVYGARLDFHDNSSADLGNFIVNGVAAKNAGNGEINFYDHSTAANATFTAEGARYKYGSGGSVLFYDGSNAGQATLIAEGGVRDTAYGGEVSFLMIGGVDRPSAAESTVIANGGVGAGTSGGSIGIDSAEAGNATFIVNGGTNGGGGGSVAFFYDATGGTSRIILNDTGALSVNYTTGKTLIIGSLEGDGVVNLGSRPLAIGANALSTVFSGVISGTGALEKVGSGALTLSGPNTFTGGMTVSAGTLAISNATGSGTGSGRVSVNAGTLGGSGVIAGAATIGTGSGTGAILQTSAGLNQRATLTFQSALTFKADSTYTCKLSTEKAQADQVVANGVTIATGAQFNFIALARKPLSAGAVFTVISNTASTPISGTFANLPDGSIFTAGRNIFQARYTGGDGNDLTLTVVP